MVELDENGAADWRKLFSIMVTGGNVFATTLVGGIFSYHTLIGGKVPPIN